MLDVEGDWSDRQVHNRCGWRIRSFRRSAYFASRRIAARYSSEDDNGLVASNFTKRISMADVLHGGGPAVAMMHKRIGQSALEENLILH
jgi:hypothetical protein